MAQIYKNGIAYIPNQKLVLTSAAYSQLTSDQKNNGTIYFLSDTGEIKLNDVSYGSTSQTSISPAVQFVTTNPSSPNIESSVYYNTSTARLYLGNSSAQTLTELLTPYVLANGISSLKVTSSLIVPTSAPSSPVIGSFWVE